MKLFHFFEDDNQWENSKLESQVQGMQSYLDIGLNYTGNIQKYVVKKLIKD